ncbi:MAG: hypothetical protein WAT19_03520 [Ferruginibacter sp.]
MNSFQDYFQLIMSVCMILVLGTIVLLFIEIRKLKEKIQEKIELNDESKKLKLQALERLTLFAERAGLQSLVTRADLDGKGAASLHYALISSIKSEFEYNTSQQLYVNPEIWNAVTRLKDQNIYIINQLAAPLPPQATALDLSKRLLEYSMQENAELNHIVLDALRYEAARIIN